MSSHPQTIPPPPGPHAPPQIFVSKDRIDRARELAWKITASTFEHIERHTTVSTERTVLRLLGISGAGPQGVPLANLMVDRLLEAGVLHRGAAYWLGRAMRMGGRSPVEMIEQLTRLSNDELRAPLAADEEAAIREEMRAEAEAAMAELKSRVEQREGLKKGLKIGSSPDGAPLKYLIVATGNIFDDVEQARSAAQNGADIIAVIRSTAQSLLDYVPHGATTEGFGGTFATQENFRIMREALDDESKKLGRYIHLVNYSSGLCMPEIAFMAAWERLDHLLNDAMYGILFRDINPQRTMVDQYFSRRICAYAGILINTGEDNYITTADAYEAAHQVIASQFINEAFAHRAGLPDEQIGLGHSFEIDTAYPDTLLWELAQAYLIRGCFPKHPLKYMPPTKHKDGDIFFAHAYDAMADLMAIWTRQGIQLLGMMTEAMHNPFLMDRYSALKMADYLYRAGAWMGDELQINPNGRIAQRQREVMENAISMLEEAAEIGMFDAIAKGRFAGVKRPIDGGKGLAGVIEKGDDYFNPILEILERDTGVVLPDGRRVAKAEVPR
ncbi:lysine 5,6-aminomutase subunit alpha [Vulgatibacter incomptus]|uniref:L-beta-lysine 5,6-aminomutase alpha subunit n=1 Tax=Vulgatibacter incomptus TaxID=1391653 RepID=A0A0K1PDS1_9BACT|nr:lysine 5,6-aminomutase subunit alpha [Vulgatibacter incomptus]AKU91652.1 L-beta-lysine 5,6-aminomutase alpha subunit [Vulgatibacter incomptus]